MIEKNIRQLDDLTMYLNQVNSLIKECGEEFSDRIKLMRDIELNMVPETKLPQKLNLNELDLKKELKILENNK
jgi:hypothetical protein